MRLVVRVRHNGFAAFCGFPAVVEVGQVACVFNGWTFSLLCFKAAAERAGITKVPIPKDNVPDLKEVSKEVIRKIQIVSVETIEDVLKGALGIALLKIEQVIIEPVFFTRLIEQHE